MEEVIRIFCSGDWISLNINGYHREDDLPAVEKYNGDKFWYKNGNIHREGGLPAIECSDGSKAWYKNGKLHREDGPALITNNGNKYWYLNGRKFFLEEEYQNELFRIKLQRILKL